MKEQLALYSSLRLTGKETTSEITIPDDFKSGYVTVILSAPVDEKNIFDIEVIIEVSEDDGKTWQVRDTTNQYRDLIDGALEAVMIGSMAQIENLAGNKVRARLSCGQSILNASVTITY